MNSAQNIIGSSNLLEEGGKGVRFLVKDRSGENIPAFAVCYDGQIYAYLNKCGHIAVQLDYMPGEFFSDDGQTIMCSTHGAEYAPDTGACLGGPCYGIGLEPLNIEVVEGQIFLKHADYELVELEKETT